MATLPIVRGNYPSVFKYLRTICTKEGRLGVQTWRVELGIEEKPVLGCLEQNLGHSISLATTILYTSHLNILKILVTFFLAVKMFFVTKVV